MAFRFSMLVILVAAVLSVNDCNCWGGEDLNLVGENTRIFADHAATSAKEKAASCSGWAYDKFSHGMGKGKENARETSKEAIEKASDAASKASEATRTAASESARYAAEKVNQGGGKAENVASEAFAGGRERVVDAVNSATEKINVGGVSKAFEGGKQKLEETYEDVAKGLEDKKSTTEL